MQASSTSGAAAQLSRKARRLHVGNLPLGVGLTGRTLAEFINRVMQAANLQSAPGDCVIDVFMSSEGKFAFVEFRTVDEANNAMSLDGIQLHGQSLRIARPSDYVPPPSQETITATMMSASNVPGMEGMSGAGFLAAAAATTGGLTGAEQSAMQLTRKARRIHVGNLPLSIGLTAPKLAEFVSAAMAAVNLTVRPGNCVIDSFLSGEGKFGFVEFRTVQEATQALTLTGVEFHGRTLRFERTSDYSLLGPELIQGMLGTGVLGIPGDTGVAIPAQLEGQHLAEATLVVKLSNMVTPEELDKDEECQDIKEDTMEKCNEEYGNCGAVWIPQPKQVAANPSLGEHVGIVFVEFTDLASAVKGRNGLHGQKFDDKEVDASFVTEDAWALIKAALQGEPDPAPAPPAAAAEAKDMD